MAAGQTAYACLKLCKVKGLGKIVVRAGVQSVHLIRNLTACGKNQDAGFEVAFPKRAQNGHSVYLGQIQIQQNQIVLLGCQNVKGFLAILAGIYLISG